MLRKISIALALPPQAEMPSRARWSGANGAVTTIPPDADFRAGLYGDRGWLWLGAVVAAHALLLAGAIMGMGRSETSAAQPALIGQLVSATPSGASRQPQPLPMAPKPHRPRQAREPVPEPAAPQAVRAASTLPSEIASSAHEVRSFATPNDAASSAASDVQGPVTPPRTDASHLNNPAPAYPALSRRFGEQGRVLFDVYILRDGSVGEIRLKRSSGFSRLDAAAQDAVRSWRYVPAHRGNEPIPYWYIQPITFSLNS